MTNIEIAEVVYFNVTRELNPVRALEWIRFFIPMHLDLAYQRGRDDEERQAVPRPEEEQ